MRQHENNHEVPHDFVETLHQGVLDDFLRGRLPETLEQSQGSQGVTKNTILATGLSCIKNK